MCALSCLELEEDLLEIADLSVPDFDVFPS